jgi:SAM-dependent methyltransferase
MSEFERWQQRYNVPEYIFGEAPNEFLAASAPLLPKHGRALAIADGEGRNGVFLARQGLDVTSVEFSPAALTKARALAEKHGVIVHFVEADIHNWDYPARSFDVAIDIFTQFSSPAERRDKWRKLKDALRPGGLLILTGYTPKQLQYGTGGPKAVEQLYTRAMLEEAFGEMKDLTIEERDVEMHEGAAHSGMSAVITLTAYRP